ncbi:MAG: peptide MFS transporter [Chlamydiales bacterium]|nr:peptide MFS transporter [Chlamydiales bacterium]
MRTFAKHPRGLWILALTELCERFAFWGVGNLLVLYLIEHYQFSGAKATHIYGILSGCAAFLPLFGGLLADRWSYQKLLFLGALSNLIGCLLLASGIPFFLYPSLVIIAGGFGIFTPSIISLLGELYKDKESLREAGFSIYYASINIGVFLALFWLGIIAKTVGWNAAFLLAAIIQGLGVIPIIWYFRELRTSHKKDKQTSQTFHLPKKPLTQGERRRVLAISLFCLLSIFFWTAYNQAFSSMSIFAHSFMNKTIGGYNIPEGVFLSTESLFLVFLAPLLALLYGWLQKKNKDPSVALKMMCSFFFIAIGFFIMVIATRSLPLGALKASLPWGYLIGAYFAIAISEMLLAPISLSMVSSLAPRKAIGFLIGLWYVCVGIAYYIGGVLAGFIETTKLNHFFGLFIIITLIPASFLLLFHKKLTYFSRRDPSEIDETPHIPR